MVVHGLCRKARGKGVDRCKKWILDMASKERHKNHMDTNIQALASSWEKGYLMR